MTPRCQYEVGTDRYSSILCARPAVILINRRDLGHLALCRRHYTTKAVAEVERQHYAFVRVP